jgi:hypothetical protein
MRQVGAFLDDLIKISKQVQDKSGKKLKEFQDAIVKSEDIHNLAKEVEEFAS